MSAALKLNPQPNIKLIVQQGPHAGQRFSFSKNKISIGRSPENDIILVNDPLISRQHAYIEIVDNDVEIVNLSQKNPIVINNESINKWKLTSGTVFLIGGTEFLIQIENQQSVVVMKQPQASKKASVNLVKSPPLPQKPVISPANVVKKAPLPMYRTPQFSPPPQSQNLQNSSSKFKFYMFIGVVLALGLYLGLSDTGSKANKTKKSVLQYSDEIAFKINSKESQELLKKREIAAQSRQSIAYIRAEENFAKGMRAFQLNNFGMAMDHFQLTLVSLPDHVLAKRYLYLSRVRFDEVLKAKLDLGQSYYERNNFKLCMSMFQQAIDMLQSRDVLQGTPKNTNLQLAETMLKKCEFAAEGIR